LASAALKQAMPLPYAALHGSIVSMIKVESRLQIHPELRPVL
jgi:hypothetical protein